MSKAPPRTQIARSAARLATVQGLYQMDLASTSVDEVILSLADSPVLEVPEEQAGSEDVEPVTPDATFLAELLRGVVREQRQIDPMIDQQLASGWRLNRIDSTLRAILRAGVFELLERAEVPARVVINEYVEIARSFFDKDEPRVVNAVLDKLARRLRPDEFDPA